MKGAARLILFYLGIFLFVASAGSTISAVRGWTAAAAAFPPRSFSFWPFVLSTARDLIPAAVYVAVLFSCVYAARHAVGPVLSGLVIFLFTALILFISAEVTLVIAESGTSAFSRLSRRQDGLIIRVPGAEAVIMTGAGGVPEIAAISVVGERLRLPPHAGDGAVLRAEAHSPFEPFLSAPRFMDSFSAEGSRLSVRLREAGSTSLLRLAYAAAFALLLATARGFSGLIGWPLADLVVCAAALRGYSAFSDLALSPAFQRAVASMLPGLPGEYAAALVIGAAACSLIACAFLAAVARRSGERRSADA